MVEEAARAVGTGLKPISSSRMRRERDLVMRLSLKYVRQHLVFM
jgi:hypothetical protein